MKAIVVYDSIYGNTEQIARAIGKSIPGDVTVLRIGEVNPAILESTNLLIIGSPTQGGKSTKAMQEFLNKIPDSSFKNLSLATFDTRLSTKLVKLFGYAAGKMANGLQNKCNAPILASEGFFVDGSKGPLKAGELERAASWAKTVVESVQIKAR